MINNNITRCRLCGIQIKTGKKAQPLSFLGYEGNSHLCRQCNVERACIRAVFNRKRLTAKDMATLPQVLVFHHDDIGEMFLWEYRELLEAAPSKER